MSNSALNELGFAEFVAKLISDTFGAVLASQIEQQDKISELNNLLTLSDDEFVAKCMQDHELVFQLEENHFAIVMLTFDKENINERKKIINPQNT